MIDKEYKKISDEEFERKKLYRDYNRNLLKTCRNILKDHSNGILELSEQKLKEVNKLKRKLLKKPRNVMKRKEN